MNSRIVAFALAALFGAVALTNADPFSGACQILGNRTYTPDTKSCSNCQWQSLTDALSTGIIFDEVTYTKNQLATWNCGDGRWLNQSTEWPSAGFAVLFNASGAIVDTQEQGCYETAQQCLYWSECTGFAWNFVLVTKDNGFAYCASIGAPNPYATGGRKMLASDVMEEVEGAKAWSQEISNMMA